ncbi:dATP/dGTP diphosphohydrolase domain-containing protein [Cycloclasticus pugetii]|uniref:dATP/dGTP diphosphohydrolase domain-containing protein n=1 Tax=Cycloclasticus pugetii TaxID=34068 RepID=UPI003A90E829
MNKEKCAFCHGFHGDDVMCEPSDRRMNAIAQNGNDGEHYAEAGVKYDTGKPAMNLIPPNIELEVARVLTFGAEKYGPENWRLVQDARNRYMAAAMRHISAMRRGYVLDDESGISHAAHAICCLMFMGEVELEA